MVDAYLELTLKQLHWNILRSAFLQGLVKPVTYFLQRDSHCLVEPWVGDGYFRHTAHLSLWVELLCQRWSWADGKVWYCSRWSRSNLICIVGIARLVPPLPRWAYMVTSLSGTPVSSEERDQSQEDTSIPEGCLCCSSNLLTMLSYQLRL